MNADDDTPDLPPAIREVLDSWGGTPAFVRDRHLVVVAANPLARAVSPAFVEGVDLARRRFVDTPGVDAPADAEGVDRAVVAALRGSISRHENDETFAELLADLNAHDGRFAAVWAEVADARPEHDAERDGDEPDGGGPFVIPNPTVGALRLAYRTLRIPDHNEFVLVVLRAADESSRVALDRLAELATGAAEA